MTNLQDIPLETIDGRQTTLGHYAGKVLLIVNTASKCGLTPQYEGLEALFSKYRDQGLVVLGFPSNDFAGQEPGTNEEISSFCSVNYKVDFPMFAKTKVVGPEKHPLFASLVMQQPKAIGAEAFRTNLRKYKVEPNPEPELMWNFEKFLVARDGRAVERFSPDMSPENADLAAAIERELKLG